MKRMEITIHLRDEDSLLPPLLLDPPVALHELPSLRLAENQNSQHNSASTNLPKQTAMPPFLVLPSRPPRQLLPALSALPALQISEFAQNTRINHHTDLRDESLAVWQLLASSSGG